MNKPKVSYYISHPIQYFSPLFVEMAKSFDLHVYYFSDASIKGNVDKGFGQKVKWDMPLLNGYSNSFLKNYSNRKSLSNRTWDVVNPGVIQTLARDRSPVVIVNGWSYFSTLLTIFTAWVLRKKIWLRAENTITSEQRKSKKLLFFKRLLLKHLLFRMIDRFLYIGEESRKFFEFYGAKPEQLIYTPYAVDNDFFSSAFESNKDRRMEVRSQLGLPLHDRIILYTGKFIAVKRPLDLVEAFQKLNMPDVSLVMVGDGELRKDIEAFINMHSIQNVFLTGFVNQSLISEYYSIADVLVLCSESETWGLSVNEGMNFELPLVVSDTVGCAKDLVVNGVNGFIFPKGDVTEFSKVLKKLLTDEALRSSAGKMSAQLVKEYNHAATVKNLMLALK